MTKAASPASTPGEMHAHARAQSTDDRIREFRRRLGGTGATVVALGVVNMITTPTFPWFLFPAVFMSIPLAGKLGGLWAEGVGLSEIFSRKPRSPRPRAALGAGDTRAAIAAERTRGDIAQMIGEMSAADRGLLPEVMPTVDRLVERIRLLAGTIAGLDSAMPPGAMHTVEHRIAEAEREGRGDKTLTLLKRQRDSLTDLLERRTLLRGQLDSAQLALEHLRLQIVKLRSAGVQSAIENVTSATQEARALARDIGHVLDAAAELRALDRPERRGPDS